jgi:hypothetical protein
MDKTVMEWDFWELWCTFGCLATALTLLVLGMLEVL